MVVGGGVGVLRESILTNGEEVCVFFYHPRFIDDVTPWLSRLLASPPQVSLENHIL